MKKILTIAVAIMAITLCGCRSKKNASESALEKLTPIEEVESSVWKNVYAPITIDIIRPMQFTASGRITMVRGESIYLSIRMLGMEVANAYASPTQSVVAMKLPKKMAMEIPLTEKHQSAGVSFAEIQEALLGNEDALSKLPSSVTYKADTSDSSSVVELYTTYGGKDLAVRFTWDLKSAKWDQSNLSEWKAPGSDYTRVTPTEALKMASGILK